MDIFHEVEQILVECETPREFLVAAMGDDWQDATIAQYRPESDRCYYTAVLAHLCPGCGDLTIATAAFVTCQQDGYRMLKPENAEQLL